MVVMLVEVMLVEAVVKNKGNDDFLKLVTCFYFAKDSILVTCLPWSQPTKLQNILTSKMLFSSKAAVTFWSQQRILIFIKLPWDPIQQKLCI